MAAIRKIMVAYDFSVDSGAALTYACALARELAADVIVVNVIHQRDLDAVKWVANTIGKLSVDEYIRVQQAERTRELDAILQEIPGPAPPVRKSSVPGRRSMS